MHELGVTKKIAETVVACAEENGAHEMTAVNLIIGKMRNLEQEWVQRYFYRCAKGTVAENAQVNITYVPIAFYCNDCTATFTLDVHKDERMRCTECGSTEFSMVCGKELTIKSIEMR